MLSNNTNYSNITKEKMQYIISIGSNLGDRAQNIQISINYLTNSVSNIITSSIYETDAVLPKDAPRDWNKAFLNLCLAFESNLNPKELLLLLKGIERTLGRTKMPKWSPRIIDLDILLAGEEVIKEDEVNENFLVVPHCELLSRNFFLIPAAEIAPNYIHPVTKKTLKHHAKRYNQYEIKLYGKLASKIKIDL